MKKFYPLFLLMLPLLTSAQANLKPGYIITLKGDTLHGYIDFKEWNNNPKYINFKNVLSEKTQRLTPKNITAFAISGFEEYELYGVHISTDPIDVNNISTTIDTSYVTDTVFLKVLLKGNNVSLLMYRDGLKQRFYLKNNKTFNIQELVYRAHFSNDNNTKTVIYNNLFRNQIIREAHNFNKDSSQFIQQAINANYAKSDLSAIIAKINNDNYTLVKTKMQKTAAVRFFAGAGLSIGQLNFYGINMFAQNTLTSYTPGPKITTGFDVFMNPAVRKLLLRFEIAACQSKYSFVATNSNVTGTPMDGNLDINHITIALNPKIIYNIYNGNSAKVFIGGGLSIESYFYPTDITNTTTHPNPYVSMSNTSTNNPRLKNIGIGLNLTTGVIINKRIELNVVYLPPHTLTDDYVSFHASLTNYQFGLNYLLGK